MMNKLGIIWAVAILIIAIVAGQETNRENMKDGKQCPRQFAGKWVESEGRRCFCQRKSFFFFSRYYWRNCTDIENPSTTEGTTTTEEIGSTTSSLTSTVVTSLPSSTLLPPATQITEIVTTSSTSELPIGQEVTPAEIKHGRPVDLIQHHYLLRN